MQSLTRFLFVLAFLTVGRVSAQDGIFADFSTSLGNFTCRLEFEKAPRTVANFISLATGDRAWLDLPTGDAKRTPFYNGLTFHRVVAGFVIQGGSPKGDGSDGPGYMFRDEFDATLRHNAAGILSMANSGLHSNGSQFFVTLGATPWLDDVHSVFGSVTSGLSVVNAIGSVSVDGAGKPLVPVIMNGVTIRRVGAAALAFNVHAQGLPTVGGANPVLLKSGPNFALQFNRSLYHEYWAYNSANLATWTAQRIGLYVTTPPVGNYDVTASATGQLRQFYRVPDIAYPGPLYTPPSHFGKTITFNFNDGIGTIIMAFNSVGGGTMTHVGNSSGTIPQSFWVQDPYRGRLEVYSTNLVPLLLTLAYNNSTSGIFKGTAYTANPFPVSGTFVSTP